MEFLLLPIILVCVMGFVFFGKYVLIKWVVDKGGKTNPKKKNIIRIPFAFRLVMLLVTAFGIGCIFLATNEDRKNIFFWLTIAIVILIPFLLFLTWTLWKIEFTDEGFTYRNFIGIKKSYKFKDLELREHPKGMKWYFYKGGKKVVCVDCYKENENELMQAYYYVFYGLTRGGKRRKKKSIKEKASGIEEIAETKEVTETEEKGD